MTAAMKRTTAVLAAAAIFISSLPAVTASTSNILSIPDSSLAEETAAPDSTELPTETSAPADAPSEDVTENGFTVTSDGTLKGYSGEDTRVTVPAKVGQIPVKRISADAFSGSGVTVVSLPAGIEAIDTSAFKNCRELTRVVLPRTLKSIPDDAFHGCISLVAASIPSTIESIGSYAFCNCSSLLKITVPESVKDIGAHAFDGCTMAESIDIPSGITVLREGVLADCSSVMFLTIPDSVSVIENSALYGCGNLASVTLPASLAEIGKSAFAFCVSLAAVDIPDGVTVINDNAFLQCASLRKIALPDTLSFLGSYAFYKCINLREADTGAGIKSIESHTFGECAALSKITIRRNVESIDASAFTNTKNITIYGESEYTRVFASTHSIPFKDIPLVPESPAPATLPPMQENPSDREYSVVTEDIDMLGSTSCMLHGMIKTQDGSLSNYPYLYYYCVDSDGDELIDTFGPRYAGFDRLISGLKPDTEYSYYAYYGDIRGEIKSFHTLEKGATPIPTPSPEPTATPTPGPNDRPVGYPYPFRTVNAEENNNICTFTILCYEYKKGLILSVSYDENGRITRIENMDLNGQPNYTLSASVTSGDHLKLFIWEPGSQTPLCEPFTFERSNPNPAASVKPTA